MQLPRLGNVTPASVFDASAFKVASLSIAIDHSHVRAREDAGLAARELESADGSVNRLVVADDDSGHAWCVLGG